MYTYLPIHRLYRDGSKEEQWLKPKTLNELIPSYRKKRLHQHGMFGLPEGFACCNLFCSFVGVQIQVIETWQQQRGWPVGDNIR